MSKRIVPRRQDSVNFGDCEIKTYTFTADELKSFLILALKMFSDQPNVYDFSGDAAAKTVQAMMNKPDPIPFDGSIPETVDTGDNVSPAAIGLSEPF